MIMNDSKTMGSVAEKLLCLVSTSVIHDFNYEIAVSLLKNYGILKNMSIGEIADLCYVSKRQFPPVMHYFNRITNQFLGFFTRFVLNSVENSEFIESFTVVL